ncbi:uncharacterized protein FIBRA_03807 [Fibroporia radiculosa]|uniref:VWFA domain-containing protein n=1 Tax=Fibroporia radiculosa TaxID=599839 RepID=J4I9T9_9APHY|nr:uncharacterized protein FIBRA_03807 [Fibroporia radiculosa]CCM01741.1 predicted protein [Fibroporia radiculosa]
MGQNHSKSSSRTATVNSLDSISKPKALAATAGYNDYSKDSPDSTGSSSVHRRATAHASNSHSLLSLPGSNSAAHRRSKSAVVQPAHNRESAPPPYAIAVASTEGSSISDSLTVPQLSEHASRRNSWGSSTPGSQPPNAQSHRHSHVIPAGVPPIASSAERVEALRRPMRQNSVENALDTLRKYNTVIIVDDSGSMQGERWREARDALAPLADIASKYDADGVDVCFLNDKHSSETVRRIFDHVRPRGITPIGEKLEELLLFYLDSLEYAKSKYDAGDLKAMKSIRPVNYIVITDGAPTDDPEAVIVAAARRLDKHNFPLNQVGIQFVQIGDSPDATAFLHELDDCLSQTYGIRDIVDTTPYLGGQLSADMIIKILLGGINRRVDRRGAESVL